MIPYVTPFANIIITAVPLLMTALGALASERAGILAVFLDGIINIGIYHRIHRNHLHLYGYHLWYCKIYTIH